MGRVLGFETRGGGSAEKALVHFTLIGSLSMVLHENKKEQNYGLLGGFAACYSQFVAQFGNAPSSPPSSYIHPVRNPGRTPRYDSVRTQVVSRLHPSHIQVVPRSHPGQAPRYGAPPPLCAAVRTQAPVSGWPVKPPVASGSFTPGRASAFPVQRPVHSKAFKTKIAQSKSPLLHFKLLLPHQSAKPPRPRSL